MRNDKEKLEKILECIDRIKDYTRKGPEALKTHDAVVRNYQVIGEAVKDLSDELKVTILTPTGEKHQDLDIDFRSSGMQSRKRLSHFERKCMTFINGWRTKCRKTENAIQSWNRS